MRQKQTSPAEALAKAGTERGEKQKQEEAETERG